MSSKSRGFWLGMKGHLNDAVDRMRPVRAAIQSVPGNGLYQIVRAEDLSGVGELEQYARIAGFVLNANDEVICLPTGRGLLILGKLQYTTPTGYALDAPLTLDDGRIAGYAPMSPLYQDAADNGPSTTNTVTFVEAGTSTFALPAVGTWDIEAQAWIRGKNSAPVSIDFRLNINAVAQPTANFLPDTTSYTTLFCAGFQTGLTGSVVVKAEIKGHSASTTGYTNPLIIARARRTA